jgi:hypothetical protein
MKDARKIPAGRAASSPIVWSKSVAGWPRHPYVSTEKGQRGTHVAPLSHTPPASACPDTPLLLLVFPWRLIGC